MSKKKLVTGVVASAILLTAVLGALYVTPQGDGIFRKPESVFYKNLGMESRVIDSYVRETAVDTDESTRMTMEGFVSRDGEMKGEGSISCDVKESPGRSTAFILDVRTVNADNFMKFREFTAKGLTTEQQTVFDANTAPLTGTWVRQDNPNYDYLSLKDNGVLFNAAGAFSNTISQDDIVKAFRDNHVFTIVSSKKEGTGKDRVYSYTISVRKGAYEKAMDQLVPNAKYKSEMLAAIFEEDTAVEYDIAIGVDDAVTRSQSYKVENVCREFAASLSESAAKKMPEHVKIKNERISESAVKKLTAPDDAVPESEFFGG